MTPQIIAWFLAFVAMAPPMTVQPNNLGPTLLIAAGIVTAPAGVGILFLLTGLALIREADGKSSFPRLSRWLSRLNLGISNKFNLRINRSSSAAS